MAVLIGVLCAPVDDRSHASQIFKIVVLGGSTSWGEPYSEWMNPGIAVKELLSGTVRGLPIVVQSLGAPGAPSAQLLEDAARVDDDATVVLIYSGHNEFLAHDIHHDLEQARIPTFEPSLPEGRREEVLAGYRANLDAAIASLRARRIPVILSTVVANWADWDPNLSVLREPGHRDLARALLERAGALDAIGRARDLIDDSKHLLELEPRFAHAHKYLADAYREIGDYASAKHHYELAADTDGNPYRVLSEQNEIVRDLGRKHGIPVAEAKELFERHSPHGLVGFNLMLDNCHPTFEGYLLLGQAFAEQLANLFPVNLPPSGKMSPAALGQRLGLDTAAKSIVDLSRADFCMRMATLTAYPAFRLARARFYLDRVAGDMASSAWRETSYALLSALAKNPADSESHWRRAYHMDPDYTRKRWETHQVTQIMRRDPALRDVAARLAALF